MRPIQEMCSPFPTKSLKRCEAAAHAMTQAFDQDESEAILFVDAANAFNSINRKVLLHNIQYLCPVLAIDTISCYQSPSRLFVQGGKEISSAEGTTQGDPIAMPIYAIGITLLLREIKDPNSKVTRQPSLMILLVQVNYSSC